MTRQEFINGLKSELEINQIKNVSEILSDYEEHFNHGVTKGKSESDIAASLGSPSTIAKAYKTETMIQEIKNPENKFRWGLALNILIRLMVLAPFNFFFLLIPGVVIFSMMTAGWSVALALGAVGVAILWNIPAILGIATSFWLSLAGASVTIGLLGTAFIAGLIMFFITKYVVLGLISYLQWNLKFVMEK